jgi:hypothetical protein
MLRLAKRLLPSLAAAGILITIGGCADAPTAPAELALDAQFTPVATSRTAATTPVGVLIGPQGGVIETGGHRLVFPAGALARPTMITMQPMAEHAGVVFSPHGLVFPAGAQPELTLSLEGANLSAFSSVAIGYQAPSGSIEEIFAATLSPGGTAVSANIPHFSGYIAISH